MEIETPATGAGTADLVGGTAGSEGRELARVRRSLDRLSRRRGVLPPPQVLLVAPGLRFAYGDGEQVFDAASVGKVFTATLLMQLVERGRLALSDPMVRHLPEREHAGVFVHDGVDHAAQVTVEHLLTHTSGAADFFLDRTHGGPRFRDRMLADLDRFWTPADLIDHTRRFQRPVGRPGRRFRYSDTGFDLLSRVVEEVGGASLGDQLHERIFRPLGMERACLVLRTMPGGGPADPVEHGRALDLAPIVLAGVDVSRRQALSVDWGGGGVVATPGEFVRFSQALHAGELVSPAGLARMARFEHRLRPGIHYGAGLAQVRYGGMVPLLGGMPRAVGGIGLSAAHMFAIPERDIHLVMNFHDTREMSRSFQVHIALMRAALRHTRAR